MSKILRIVNISENTSLKNSLPLVAGMMDNKDLSKFSSGQPSRYLLAFFVRKFWLASQATQDNSTAHLPQFTGVIRHTYAHSVTSYGGVTLQNKPLRQICEAVTCVTESEPRHPMNFHSVANTQNNTQGGIIMPNQIIMPAGNTQISQRKNTFAHSATDSTAHTPAQDEKPLYIPSYWERKDGYFKDGVFHKPSYEIFNNGAPLEPLGVSFGYRYEVANHILMHLQAVSSDNFTIKPTSWQPMNDFNVVMEGKA